MPHKEHQYTENYAHLVSAFSQLVDSNQEGKFTGSHLSEDWQLIDEVNYYKIKAVNDTAGIFVKKYSPFTGDYSQKAYNALGELASLSLSVPILSLLALHQNTLVFKRGQFVERRLYSEIYDDEQLGEIEDILFKYEMKHLGYLQAIDIVSVDGRNYAVDPYEDSAISIFQYIEKQDNKAVGFNKS